MIDMQTAHDFIAASSKRANEQVEQNNSDQLNLLQRFYTFISKYDPDFVWVSGLKYKSESEDAGVSVDGHARGNGWKVIISWEENTHILWSPDLRALLVAALELVEGKVK